MLTKTEYQHAPLYRILADASDEILHQTVGGEITGSAAEECGAPYSSSSGVLPWSHLARALAQAPRVEPRSREVTARGFGTRDLTVAGEPELVGDHIQMGQDILRQNTPLGRMGATIMSGLRADISIPMFTSTNAGGWLASETASGVNADPVVDQVTLSPKYCAALVTFSHQIGQQGMAVERWLAQTLINAAVDLQASAVIAGSGASGQPQGVVGTTGVETVTGTSFSHALAREAVRKLEANGASPNAWVGAPATVETLSTRETATGSGRYVWDNNQLGGVNAISTNAAPASTLVLGDWRHALVGVWGNGLQFAVDTSTGFSTGAITVRVMLGTDVQFVHPGAFATVSSVT